MGFVLSLLIIAAGAILTWAVNVNSSSVNLDVIGIILMAVGGVGFLLTLAFWESWWGPGYFRRPRGYAGRDGYYDTRGYRPRRGDYVVEEEEETTGPPAGPPP